jgi:class 3 adenylate cyclase/tetratricopeptide (TPR) repeat protein
VLVCANCGQESPESFRFCPACAASLSGEAGAPREERKVVTVLFADLVGFTSRSERLDPEDVRAVLAPYHARLRTELERHGGTVEKFIGDAVMAVFGAPIAHEDDPERAVRAALAIRSWVTDEQRQLQVRIGINTGETIVNLAARPAEGEGMVAGDVVNTAARLQAAAPIDGILVGAQTHEATKGAIEYDDAPPVSAKGKAEVIPVWSVRQARSRFGVDVSQATRTPLVGREGDLRLLVETLERVRRERSTQLVTLVGVPGIGKSRLVYELFKHAERDLELITWRQGRCLPYGDGVSFWALGEVIKAQAGILETDVSEQAAEKLHTTITAAVAAEQAGWVESHVSPLIGLGPERAAAGDRRAEAFAAWRQFLEALAEQRPLVLVLEDLQWADEGLLDFVDHLVDWSGEVPLLVVGTARPELLTRRLHWGGGKANAATVSLSPLTNEETAELVHALLQQAVLPAETQATVLARAGGNPLYAEEYARLLLERGGIDDAAMPESVQGIIAARLDLLSTEAKALVQAAAVLGKVFWLGAVAAVSGHERWQVEETLHDLERHELVRRERRSSMEGETEYAFRHLLVRDVAYGQIPRSERAERHTAAATWIESLGRVDDHAEMLAHHYVKALELSRAAGIDEAELAERARGALRVGGDRALGLNAWAAAVDLYGKAVALWPSGAPDRPALLLSYGSALQRLGDDRAGDVLAEARDGLVTRGDPTLAALAESQLATFWWDRGQRDRSSKHRDHALALVADQPTSPDKLDVLTRCAISLGISAEIAAAIRLGEEALAMAEQLGLDEYRVRALGALGMARSRRGDPRGDVDQERAFELAVSLNSPEAGRLCNNLAFSALIGGDARRNAELRVEALRTATRFGDERMVRFFRGVRVGAEYAVGRWDDAARYADEFVDECEAGSPHYLESEVRQRRAGIHLARGDVARATADSARALELVREAKDPQIFDLVLSSNIRIAAELGDVAAARALADELLPTVGAGARIDGLIELAWAAGRVGVADDLRNLLEGLEPASSRWLKAGREILDEDFAQAAETFAQIGCVPDEAEARLRDAETLVAAGRRTEADAQLARALSLYRSLGAKRYLHRGEQLLADSA